MVKSELIAKVALNTGEAKTLVEKIINGTFAAIKQAVADGDKVQLVDFGTFDVRDRQERMGRNPRTGEEIKLAATQRPHFKAGKSFKEMVAK